VDYDWEICKSVEVGDRGDENGGVCRDRDKLAITDWGED
jgi:hypothetical protein